MEVAEFATTDVCSLWASIDDMADCCADLVGTDEAQLTWALTIASDLLYNLSGHQYPGECRATVRPCASYQSCWTPLSETWYARDCGCRRTSHIRLAGYPVREIVEVTIDGDLISPLEYRLDYDRELVRLSDADGNSQFWPTCQRLDLNDGVGTFFITYTYGVNPTVLGSAAAAQLACEIAKQCPGAANGSIGDCALPAGTVRISRQGITIDSSALGMWLIGSLRTGMPLVDAFLSEKGAPRGQRRTALSVPEMDPWPLRVATVPPPPPPTVGVELVSPAAGSTLSGTVEFRVYAYDPAGLTGVVFYASGFNVGTDPEGVDNVNHEYTVTVDTTTFDNGELTFSCDVYVVPGVLTYTLPQVTYTVSNLPATTSLPPDGYNLVFEDNFDAYDLEIVGAAHIVNGQWHDHVWYAGYPPDGSQYVEDGILHLVSKRSDGYPQITMATYHPAANPQITFKQGYFETLMRWTGGQGAWPAFWLNSASAAANPNWPDPPPGFPDPTTLQGELDILEVQGAQPDIFYGTLHRNTGGPWGVPDSTAPALNAFTLPDNFNDEWHIISCLWTLTDVIWYFDHQEILHTTPFDSTNQEMMLILQMEVGGWMGGADETTPDELHAEFDYVRVYQAP